MLTAWIPAAAGGDGPVNLVIGTTAGYGLTPVLPCCPLKNVSSSSRLLFTPHGCRAVVLIPGVLFLFVSRPRLQNT